MRSWEQVLRCDASKTGGQIVFSDEDRDALGGAFDHVARHVEEGFSGFGPSSDPDDRLADREVRALRHAVPREGLGGVTIRPVVCDEL